MLKEKKGKKVVKMFLFNILKLLFYVPLMTIRLGGKQDTRVQLQLINNFIKSNFI